MATALLAASAPLRCGAVDASVNVTAEQARTLSPMLYGLFFEEINFAGDGGLYAELIRNRDFEALGRGNLGDGQFDETVLPRKGDYRKKPATPVAAPPAPVYTDYRPWYPVVGAGAAVTLGIDNTTHPFPTNPATLKVTTDTSKCGGPCVGGFGNPGYWGIGIAAGKNYKVSFYASSSSGTGKAVRYEALLVIPDPQAPGQYRTVASVGLPVFGSGWSQYSSFLQPTESHPNAHLQIVTTESNTAWFEAVSLFPEDAVLGLFRSDLYHQLEQLQPAFIRFPGGNYLEGNEFATSWQWKHTLNQTEARPGHYNSAWGYWNTDGLGLYEFFLLCQALKAEPQMAIYTGYDLSHHYIPINQSQFIVQDALDAIQYANGDPNFSKWGRVRANNGQTKPFHMKRIEVGNEELLMQDYAEHYQLITQAIWAKYPNMTVIASGRWGPAIDGSPCLTGQRCDLWDDHFYRPADQLAALSTWYDSYDRKLPKVFVGEYAANGNGDQGTLRAALAEAAFLIGLERNGDAVLASSFAPLFRNVKGSQWSYDLINFNTTSFYTIPSYHVQRLFRSLLGGYTLKASFAGVNISVSSVQTLPKNQKNLVIKIVHYAPYAITCDIQLDPALKPAGTSATQTVLTSGSPTDANTMDEPTKVQPVASQITFNTSPFKLQLPAWSLVTLEIPLQ